MSFGDEAEEEEEEVLAATKNFSTKGNSAHDIAQDPTLSASTGKTVDNDEAVERYGDKFCLWLDAFVEYFAQYIIMLLHWGYVKSNIAHY